MKLETVVVKNFRCYEELEIDLHPQTTVLVANNGQGKTSVLDAIRVALWPYVSQFDLAKGAYVDPANTITIDDVRIVKVSSESTAAGFGVLDEMARQFASSVTATGDYGKGKKIWERYRDSEAVKSQTKDDKACRDLKSFAKGLQQQVRDLDKEPKTLPVFGYYGTGRLWKEKRLTESKKGSKANDEGIRTFAFRDCLDPASSYRQFEDWFTAAYKRVLEHQISQLQRGTTFIDVDPKLKIPVKVVQDAVNEVLKPVGWQNLQFSQRDDESLVLRHDEYGVMKADQLSDGIKNILAMIADIAYRAVLLNGHLGEAAAKKSPGIVMIDEVDMHLHPQWQQTVIGSLQAAFPNIQFVVTTHSPQVLSTVPSESIRIIRHEVNPDTGKIESSASPASVQSLGVASANIMAELQGVDPVPDVEQARWLTEYKALIVESNLDSEKAKGLKNRIIDHFGENHHEWLECERLRRLQVMKAKLPKRSK
ncbi:AAA family ATPase [Microbulbifer sp. JMSA004]|uniref:AAA family ATPase n=1 Tax=Microbulbifer sp. JMSA004 TaxID=3243370 RepID=UPI00403A2D6B